MSFVFNPFTGNLDDIGNHQIISEHINSTNNPHNVTAGQLGALTDTTRFLYPFGTYTTFNPLSSSPAYPYSSSLPSFTTYPQYYSQAVYITNVNNAGNYWRIRLLDFGTQTVHADINTSTLSPSSGHLLTAIINPVELTASINRYLYLLVVKVGNPSNLFVHCPAVEYTLSL